MQNLVIEGASLSCNCGSIPCKLVVSPGRHVRIQGATAANIGDHQSPLNIVSFGLCNSRANPAVQRNNNAPAECIPMTGLGKWSPGSALTTVGDQRALLATCTLLCQWQGEITVSNTDPSHVKSR